MEQIRGFSEKQLRQVIEEIPVIGKIYDLMGPIKETFYARKTENLEDWIKEAFAIGSVNKLKVSKPIM